MKKMVHNPNYYRKPTIMVSLVLPILLVVIALGSKAQQVQELNSKLASMKSSSDPTIRAEGAHLESLVYNVQPTLYFEDGQLVVTPSETPVKVITDVQSLNSVINSNYRQVEIICIKIQRIQDLQMLLDLSFLHGFPGLRYLYFQCSVEICPGQNNAGNCEIQRIEGMIKNGAETAVNITYSVSIPS